VVRVVRTRARLERPGQPPRRQEGWHVFEIDGVFELGAITHPLDWFGGHVPAAFGRTVPGYSGSGPVFASDEAVWRHVADRARGGNALHRRALDFLEARAPEERETIRSATGH
jgi:hypothetical protein